MHFCVCHIHCRVHWRASRRQGFCRSTSTLLLIGSTIMEFSISSVLWVLEALCCLYWRSSYLINHSMFWWMDVAVNRSMLCQECHRAVFWARCCSFCTPRNFFPFWRMNKLIGYADDSILIAVVWSPCRGSEKHLRSVSRVASQRLVILRKSWRVFHDRLLIGRCFWGFVLSVFEYSSAVWCSVADPHLKLLDRIVSSACVLAGGVLNCNLSHRWSVAMLCMLYKIRCNQMHPLGGALPVPYMSVRVTRGTLIAHRYTYAPSRCRTSQYRRTFIALSVSLWNDLVDPVFDGVGLAGFKSRSNSFLLA